MNEETIKECGFERLPPPFEDFLCHNETKLLTRKFRGHWRWQIGQDKMIPDEMRPQLKEDIMWLINLIQRNSCQ